MRTEYRENFELYMFCKVGTSVEVFFVYWHHTVYASFMMGLQITETSQVDQRLCIPRILSRGGISFSNAQIIEEQLLDFDADLS